MEFIKLFEKTIKGANRYARFLLHRLRAEPPPGGGLSQAGIVTLGLPPGGSSREAGEGERASVSWQLHS